MIPFSRVNRAPQNPLAPAMHAPPRTPETAAKPSETHAEVLAGAAALAPSSLETRTDAHVASDCITENNKNIFNGTLSPTPKAVAAMIGTVIFWAVKYIFKGHKNDLEILGAKRLAGNRLHGVGEAVEDGKSGDICEGEAERGAAQGKLAQPAEKRRRNCYLCEPREVHEQ
nr:hypothetical protein Iba_chr15aCG0950 [Ipomoea batatas]GMD96000.1 hypothetical protein Iba_chr15bCG0530 [Ipomoea batatas]